jgi:hypothetical protein
MAMRQLRAHAQVRLALVHQDPDRAITASPHRRLVDPATGRDGTDLCRGAQGTTAAATIAQVTSGRAQLQQDRGVLIADNTLPVAH